MSRTDAHAPSNFDPADYRVIDYIDNKKPSPPEGRDCTAAGLAIYERAVALWQERIFRYFPDWRTGGDDHQSVFTCNHCGHPAIRWVAVVEHIPTGKFLAFGEICADRCELSGRDAFRSKFIKTQAEREAAALANALAREAWNQDNADIATFLAESEQANVNWLNWNEEHAYDRNPGRNPFRAPHSFVLDMIHTLNRYGKLSERQVEATRKFAAKAAEFKARDEQRQAERDAEVAAAGPLEEGRRLITGIIVTTKWQESQFGTVPKMLVKQADGNKVWGTIPDAAFEYTPAHTLTTDDLKGREVEFTATVTRSDDDEHFGFFKRPTGIKTKEAAVAA